MLSFKQFLTEDFKSSQIIKVDVLGAVFEVSFDKISGKSINFKTYITPFTRSKRLLRGCVFSIKGQLYNLCWWSNFSHQTMLEALATKLPSLKLLYHYNATYYTAKGEKIPDDWCFTYEVYHGNKIINTFDDPDTLYELNKQKKVSKILGFTPEEWTDLRSED